VPSRSPLSPKACCPGMGAGRDRGLRDVLVHGAGLHSTSGVRRPGRTDAFAASEMPHGRHYDRLLAITRSGTTTEVLTLLNEVRGSQPTLAVTGTPTSAVLDAADQRIVLDFVDERSVVQTRFATTTLALLRASLGQDLEPVIGQADQAVVADLPAGLLERTQFTCLGSGWTVGLANEAALKMREACLKWTESYPAMEYRHGPISITDARSAVWFLTHPSASLRRRSRELRLSYSPPRGARWRSS
jgi:fructoselysine-6-P-deglycase FrlB-like protein